MEKSSLTANQVFDNYLLVEACILPDRRIAVGAMSHPAKRDGIDICQILYLEGESWSKGPYFGWEVASVAPDPMRSKGVLLLGRDGACQSIEDNTILDCSLPLESEASGPFRVVRAIGGFAFVVGEDRGVWRRNANVWEKVEAGLTVISDAAISDLSEEEIVNLVVDEVEIAFSIAGHSANELCLVGTGGELWLWAGERWHKEDLGTNVNFYDVCAHENGEFLVCGQNGSIYQGNVGEWERLPIDVDNNFCSIKRFGDDTFLADGEGLYRIAAHGIERIDFGTGEDVPVHFLAKGDDLLVAMAAKEFFFSSDGEIWHSALL